MILCFLKLQRFKSGNVIHRMKSCKYLKTKFILILSIFYYFSVDNCSDHSQATVLFPWDLASPPAITKHELYELHELYYILITDILLNTI